MDKYIFIGQTLDNALDVAKKGLNSKFIEFSVLEGSKGFLGIGKKDYKILAWINPDETPTPLNPDKKVGPVSKDIQIYKEKNDSDIETKEVKADLTDKDINIETKNSVEDSKESVSVKGKENIEPVSKEYVKEFVETMIAKMKIDCKIEVTEDEKGINVTLTDGDIGSVIGKRGDTLNALQYITNLHVNKNRHGDAYRRINIDSIDYRKRRQEALERLAKGVASKVIKTGKEISLEAMEPFERRIIHAQLQNNRKVGTKSIGEEPNRRIVVFPKN